MKIVILDAATLGADIDLSPIGVLGEMTVYERTDVGEISARLADADVAVVNKLKMNEMTLDGAKKLKVICVTATGYDNVDIAYSHHVVLRFAMCLLILPIVWRRSRLPWHFLLPPICLPTVRTLQAVVILQGAWQIALYPSIMKYPRSLGAWLVAAVSADA